MENKWKHVDCDFGELSDVGVCFCIVRDLIIGCVLGSLKNTGEIRVCDISRLLQRCCVLEAMSILQLRIILGWTVQPAPIYEICLSVPRSLFWGEAYVSLIVDVDHIPSW